MMDDVKLLSTKIFGECNLIGNVKYDKNEILENWIRYIGQIFNIKFIDIQPWRLGIYTSLKQLSLRNSIQSSVNNRQG